MGAYPGYNFYTLIYIEAATINPLKCGTWVLTWEWAFAWDITVIITIYYYYGLPACRFYLPVGKYATLGPAKIA